uniref:Uncharacterized protein n=1 Tax=Arundo donax TaxID=35708 RepID=A0A0A9AWB7_ARUDO
MVPCYFFKLPLAIFSGVL